MNKNSVTRTVLLLVAIMALFNLAAYAEGLTTFRLRIEDTSTGVGRVITDNVTLGFLNVNGDNNALAGTLAYSGNVGNANIIVYATSGTLATGGGVLSLSAQVRSLSSAGAQIKITLEDSGYIPPAPPVSFIGSVAGFDSTTNSITPSAIITAGSTAIYQTWINAANDTAPFGANSGAVALNPLTVVIPAGSTAAFAGAGTSSASGSNSILNLPLSGPYSITSQAIVSISGLGQANFNITGTDPPAGVPEPTVLVLLGSGILGLGVLRRKK